MSTTFDLQKTRILEELFAAARDARDDAWMDRFFAAVWDASLSSQQPQVIVGPDDFPYFRLQMPSGGAFDAFSVTHVMSHVLENGQGVAIFDAHDDEQPQWVLSYGDIIAHAQLRDPRGTTYAGPRGATLETVTRARSVLIATPSEEFLPLAARRAIGAFLRQRVKVKRPRLGIAIDPARTPEQTLILALGDKRFAIGSPALGELVEALSWFVPRGYAFTIADDKSLHDKVPELP